jgi:hypothetical protein
LDFLAYIKANRNNPGLKREMRLSIRSFYKLLHLIKDKLEVNVKKAQSRGAPVTPDLCLYMTLRYLAGGDIIDIKNTVGVSPLHAHACIMKTLRAIVSCESLAPHFPRTNEECAEAALYYGVNRRMPLYDNFNYYGSQCRIQIEMSFGMMTQKWRILLWPMLQKFKNVRLIVLSIARLHNFCVNERCETGGWRPAAHCAALKINVQGPNNANEADDGYIHPEHINDNEQMFQFVVGGSIMRQAMADRVLVQPITSVLHKLYVAHI